MTAPTERSGVSGTRRARPSLCSAIASSRVQVERDDKRAGAVGRRQRQRLPPTRAQAQGGVLELGFRRCKRRRELAQDLRVRMKGVARRPPGVVGKLGPV